MGNVLLQTPFAIHGFQPYFTTGGGGLSRATRNAVGNELRRRTPGGGVKIALAGPIRARVDYRVFRLNGEPLYDTVHRVYAGLNIKF